MGLIKLAYEANPDPDVLQPVTQLYESDMRLVAAEDAAANPN